ncbi:MAG TPA: hypothetical protein GXX75_25335 [Clostridiales bacterium]|nr:hypothetical protein [Clostridiales bacterium]
MARKEKKSEFHKLVKDKKLPILTLDGRWHEIFTEDRKTSAIKELEQQVNDLLKKQGKLVNDIKDMKKLKNGLMQEIMDNMDIGRDNAGKEKDKKLGRNKQFITELNEKIELAMDELGDLPYQIKEANEALMSESVALFYERLEKNKEELSQVADWINSIREELKHKILLKQDLEVNNTQIYSYMHDVLGAELMELFDKEYHIKK